MEDEWSTTIVEASYAGITFPVSSFNFSNGHDGVLHKVYGRAGVDPETTGEKGHSGSLTCPFFNDLEGFENQEVFPGLFREWYVTILSTPIAEFTHPLLGRMEAWFHDVSVEGDPNSRNGVTVTVQWTERRSTAQVLVGASGESPQDAEQSLVSQSESADAEMATADSTGTYLPMTEFTTTKLESISEVDPLSASGPSTITAAILSIVKRVNSNLQSGLFDDAAGIFAFVELERLKNSAYNYRDSLLSQLKRSGKMELPRAMSAIEVAIMSYKDAREYERIIAANAIASVDPHEIPAGTKLVIPPIGR